MNKWEYQVEYIAFIKDENYEQKLEYFEKILKLHGDNGWELVQFSDDILTDRGLEGNIVFKRPK